MRVPAVFLLLVACGCAGEQSTQAEIPRVYEAFLDRNATFWTEPVLLQEVEVPVTLGMVSEPYVDGARPGIPRQYLPEVRQALEDLLDRGRTPGRLAPTINVSSADRRISADSVEAIFRTGRRERLRRLADSASIVQLSAVGFSRDRSVAVVYANTVCGYLCGGSTLHVVRKHPGGWMAAEQLRFVIY